MMGRFLDFGAASVGSGFVTVVALLSLLQEGGFPPIDATQSRMIVWAVQVGGPLFIALLIVLWFYRRDFKSELTKSRDQTAVMMEMAKTMATAVTQITSSMDSLTVETRRVFDRIDRPQR